MVTRENEQDGPTPSQRRCRFMPSSASVVHGETVNATSGCRLECTSDVPLASVSAGEIRRLGARRKPGGVHLNHTAPVWQKPPQKPGGQQKFSPARHDPFWGPRPQGFPLGEIPQRAGETRTGTTDKPHGAGKAGKGTPDKRRNGDFPKWFRF